MAHVWDEVEYLTPTMPRWTANDAREARNKMKMANRLEKRADRAARYKDYVKQYMSKANRKVNPLKGVHTYSKPKPYSPRSEMLRVSATKLRGSKRQPVACTPYTARVRSYSRKGRQVKGHCRSKPKRGA